MVRRCVSGSLMCVLVLLFATAAPAADSTATGSHDFDFAFGSWITHIRVHRAAGWRAYTGQVVVEPIWDGSADFEQIEASSGSRRLEGMTLRLYDPGAKQWSLYWVNSGDGAVAQPMTGSFADGRGTFYDQETIGPRTAFVRNVYSDITPNSYRFAQAVSNDGGRTWSDNFTAALIRTASPVRLEAAAPALPEPAQQHGFDWQFGSWNITMARLLHPLTPAATWTHLAGTVVVEKIWHGRANLAKIAVDGGSTHLRFIALRVYEPDTAQWTLSFASRDAGTLSAPMFGSFENGRGTFYDQEPVAGKAAFDRFVFSRTGASSARDEESLSDDGGKSWHPNFVNDLTKQSG